MVWKISKYSTPVPQNDIVIGNQTCVYSYEHEKFNFWGILKETKSDKGGSYTKCIKENDCFTFLYIQPCLNYCLGGSKDIQN